MVIKLKIFPEYFLPLKEKRKTFEVRKNDRHYEVGDELLLEEFIPEGYYDTETKEGYTGEICHRKITYIFKSYGRFGIDKDTVILGLECL